MAEAQANQAPSLSESYLLEKNEKQNTSVEPLEVKEAAASVTTLAEEPVTNQFKETPAAAESTPASAVEESAPVTATEETTEAPTATEVSTEAPPAAEETIEEVLAGTGDNDENSNAQEEDGEETPEIKIETVPADFRFPTTNQTRHCFTRYVEYHRCVAAKGDGAQECDKFAKYYRSLCPSEWVEKWNEQRENGTFPGPL